MKRLWLLLFLASLALAALVLAEGRFTTVQGDITITLDTTANTTDAGTISLGIPDAYKYKSVISKIKVYAPTGSVGFGNRDTLYLKLRTSLDGGHIKTLDSNKFSAFPCSLITVLSTLDTMLYANIYYEWNVVDSATDTLKTGTYSGRIYYMTNTVLKD